MTRLENLVAHMKRNHKLTSKEQAVYKAKLYAHCERFKENMAKGKIAAAKGC